MSCTRGIRCLLFSWSELLACQSEVKLSLLQVEKPLLIITADSARFRHKSFSPIRPPAPGRGLCGLIRRQHLICGFFIVLKPFVQHLASAPGNKVFWVKPISPCWVLPIIFTVSSECTPGRASARLPLCSRISFWLCASSGLRYAVVIH